MNYYLPCKILLLVVFFGSCFANIFQATELETEVKVLSDRCVRLETIQVGVKHCVLGFFSERITVIIVVITFYYSYKLIFVLLSLHHRFTIVVTHNCHQRNISPHMFGKEDNLLVRRFLKK